MFVSGLGYSKISFVKKDCNFDEQLNYPVCKIEDKESLFALSGFLSNDACKLNKKLSDKHIDLSKSFSEEDSKADYLKRHRNSITAGKSVNYDMISQFSGDAGLIAYQKDENKIIIAFHGTQDTRDMLSDGHVFMKDLNFLGMENGEKAHEGFYDRYIEIRQSMFFTLNSFLNDVRSKKEQLPVLVFTGHSLGGALATLAALDVKSKLKSPKIKVELVTFNSPRVFNNKAAEKFENILEGNAYRIWREYDPVSGLPLGRQGYKHVGKSLKLSSVSYYPTSNHSMKHNISDITSPYKITPDDGHKGWFA